MVVVEYCGIERQQHDRDPERTPAPRAPRPRSSGASSACRRRRARRSPRRGSRSCSAVACSRVLASSGDAPPSCRVDGARRWRARRRAISRASSRRSGCGRPMIAASLNRLNRNGWTAGSESGPPRLNSTTATSLAPSTIIPRRKSRTMSATRATCSRGVSGRTPWPRLKMNGPPPRTAQQPFASPGPGPVRRPQQPIVQIALHRAVRCSSAAAHSTGTAASSPTASTPVSLRVLGDRARRRRGESRSPARSGRLAAAGGRSRRWARSPSCETRRPPAARPSCRTAAPPRRRASI